MSRNGIWKMWFYVSAVLFLVLAFTTGSVFAYDVLDNSSPGTSWTGNWGVSGGSAPYGPNSLWARNGATYSWQFDPNQPSGTYEILMWWTEWPSRSTNIPVTIENRDGPAIVLINQQQNGGQWNSLGVYYYESGANYKVTITSQPGPSSTCADAVWFRPVSVNSPPSAFIDSINPSQANPGQQVSFEGHGSDTDGTITAYQWTSDIDGILALSSSFSSTTLSEGSHIISLKAQDDQGIWSEAANATLIIGSIPIDIIIDNRDAETSKTGTWSGSGGPNPFETDSFWSRDGSTFSWLFTPLQTGNYEVSMWWTEWPSRSDTVPVTIEHADGSSLEVISQQLDGGQWNLLNVFNFLAGTTYNVTIVSQPGPSSTNADAVKFSLISNLLPVSDPSGPYAGTISIPVALDGSGSSDTDGTIVSYDWDFGDGSTGTGVTPSHTYGTIGTYTISLTVTDDDGANNTATTTVIIEPPNVPPASDPSGPYTGIVGAPVFLNGFGSSDIDGTIVSYDWDCGDGNTGTGGSLPHTYNSTGTYTISLTVTDDDGAINTATTTATIAPAPNVPPVSDPSGPYIGTIGVSVALDGSGSSDIDGTIVSYDWDFGDGNTGTGANPPHTYASIGTYTVSLMVTDDDGATHTAATAANIELPNVSPVSDPSGPYTGTAGVPVVLNGSGSSDTDGTIVSYNWDCGDGTTGTGGGHSHTYTSAGIYTLSLTVTDDDGATDTATTTATIAPAPNVPPVSDPNGPYTGTIGVPIVFDGNGSFDTVGTIVTYDWDFGDGNTGTGVGPSHMYISVGVYTVSLTVTDDDGATHTAATTATVNEIPVEFIIDNGDPQTSYTGSWSISGGADPYGSNSLYSRDGDNYTWKFTPPETGHYEASMWWTQWPSRSSRIPVDIENVDGNSRVYINQLQNGGKWNILGTYPFEAGIEYTITIISEPYPASTCADAVRFVKVSSPEPPVVEHVYVCIIYTYEHETQDFLIALLQDMGGYLEDGLWKYFNAETNKIHVFHFVRDIASYKQALETEGAVIIKKGHANYGLGTVFPNDLELRREVIDNIYYVDDERILNYGSEWMHISLGGLRRNHAWPNFWPIYQDGTNAIMPYEFGTPAGDPPFNYYMTYQLPGDPKFYKVETVANGAIQRFPDSGRPAWFDENGLLPDPTNPDHLQYYITNPAPWSPSFDYVGNWNQSTSNPGYFKENYYYLPSGVGNNEVRWLFSIPQAGDYNVSGWWPAANSNTANAPFLVEHASGSTIVMKNQRINGEQWNTIGQYYFEEGEYSVILTDQTSGGNVVADAVMVTHVDNPPAVLHADFAASVRQGPAPLLVTFDAENTGDYTDRAWDFGDGFTNFTRDYIDHTYSYPGTYTVTYSISGPEGSDIITKSDYIVVTAEGENVPPVLRAEFSSITSQNNGTVPFEARFSDHSSGDIVSWLWDFGDGQTSSDQNPVTIYLTPGNYAVSLTVTDSEGNSHTESKENYVHVEIFSRSIDNVDYPKTHYRNKIILARKELEVEKEKFKYKMMFYDSCDVGSYYLDTFNYGKLWYTIGNSGGFGFFPWVQAYLEGKSDQEIWEIIQTYEPVYNYYDFTKLPPSLQ